MYVSDGHDVALAAAPHSERTNSATRPGSPPASRANNGREEASGPPGPEGLRPMGPTTALADQEHRDEVAADDEEHLDTEEAARHPARVAVVDDHRNDRKGAQTVEAREVRDRLRYARRGGAVVVRVTSDPARSPSILREGPHEVAARCPARARSAAEAGIGRLSLAAAAQPRRREDRGWRRSRGSPSSGSACRSAGPARRRRAAGAELGGRVSTPMRRTSSGSSARRRAARPATAGRRRRTSAAIALHLTACW